MKSFLRILAVALIATMLCSSVAFAAPKSLSAIEGLPEIPENIPEMKTKNDGVTQTVTLSAPLSWLCAIRNWEWIPVTFDETGLVGTVEIDPKLSIGFARGNWSAWWDYNGKQNPDWETVYIEEDDTEETIAEKLNEATEALLERYDLRSNTAVSYESLIWYEQEDGSWTYVVDSKGEPVIDPHKVTYRSPERIEYNPFYYEDDEEPAGIWVDVMYDQWNWCYDTYAINGYGMAYEGETADGIKVRYDSYGKAMELIQTLEGVNFLGSEEAPVKTEVYFEWQAFEKNGQETGKWVIRSIKEYYADETSLHVQYSYNGDYDTTIKE